LALAEGFQASGLSDHIGENLKKLMSTRKEITLLMIIVISAISTEFTSNTSIASIFLPIVNSIVSFFCVLFLLNFSFFFVNFMS
jgi:di/tricarboxylate transporter